MSDQQIFNKLIEFFEQDNWEFQWVSGMPILSMGYSGHNGKWICYAQAREEQQQVVFYSVLPINAPKNKLSNAAEFITRANYGMIIGNFELDYDDGEIRYKTSIDIDGFDLAMPMIRQLVYANLIITDRYLPGIMRVVYGDISPEEALEESEANGLGMGDYEDIDNDENVDIGDDEEYDDDDDLYDDEYDDDFGYLDDYDDDDDDYFDPEPPSPNGSSPN